MKLHQGRLSPHDRNQYLISQAKRMLLASEHGNTLFIFLIDTQGKMTISRSKLLL